MPWPSRSHLGRIDRYRVEGGRRLALRAALAMLLVAAPRLADAQSPRGGDGSDLETAVRIAEEAARRGLGGGSAAGGKGSLVGDTVRNTAFRAPVNEQSTRLLAPLLAQWPLPIATQNLVAMWLNRSALLDLGLCALTCDLETVAMQVLEEACVGETLAKGWTVIIRFVTPVLVALVILNKLGVLGGE